MASINLKRLFEKHGLEKDKAAELLFPNNDHPRAALNRVIRRESFLDENQISKLSEALGVSIDDMYEQTWKSKFFNDTVTFTNGKYQAFLDKKTWTTKIYKDDGFFKDFVLSDRQISVSEYLEKLEQVINENDDV